MKTLAVVVSLGLVGALVWLNRNSTPPQIEEAAPVPPAATRAGLTFTPRYPAPEWPKSEFPPGSPWYQEPFTHFKLKRAVTNDGLRHFGTKFIGPMRFLPPGNHWRYQGSPYRVEIPPGYKMVETNLDHNHTGLPHVDVLVIPRTPEDDAAFEGEKERIARLNQQGQEHFRKEMRAELEQRGSTPAEIDEWFARYEREQAIMDRLGTDNYTKARRAVERAERAKLTPEQYAEWLKTLPPEQVSRE